VRTSLFPASASPPTPVAQRTNTGWLRPYLSSFSRILYSWGILVKRCRMTIIIRVKLLAISLTVKGENLEFFTVAPISLPFSSTGLSTTFLQE